jgi:fimbrial isopeptide formation D2 family protein/uncharacterized repeat protein (TIGR01451 family)
MVKIVATALVLAVTLGLVGLGDVVINEILYDPFGDEISGEWIELYNSSGSSIDVSEWTITDQDGHDYQFPTGTSISAGGYIVIHTGSGTNTSTDLYAESSTPIWNNTGDEVLLKDASDNGVDYVQYDGGSGDSPPAGLTWSGDIPGTSEGNSLALIPDGNDLDNADNWLARSGSYITQGSANQGQPQPTLTMTLQYPGGKSYVSTCETATILVTAENNDPAASVYEVSLTAAMPDDFYYVSDDQGGTYDSGAHTVTWNGDISIPANSTWSTTLTFKPNCSAGTGQSIGVAGSWSAYPGASANDFTAEDSEPITVEQTAIAVSKLVYNQTSGETVDDAAATTQAAIGDTVVFVIEVNSTGDGDIVGSGAAIADVLGQGLSLTSLKDEGGNDISYSGTGTPGDPYSWSTGPIDHDSSKYYYLSASVDACESLTNLVSYTWGCADQPGTPSCEQSGSASASITLLLKEPDISYSISPSPIDIDYCSGKTVNVTVTNGDPITPDPDVGTAYGYILTLTGLPSSYTIGNVTGATYDQVSGEFTVGDISANSEVSFSFKLQVKDGSCSPEANGTLLFTPHYHNACGEEYSPPVTLDAFSLSGRPTISIGKSGQPAVDINETGISYTITVDYNGPDNQQLTIIDDYPDVTDTENGWGNFTVSDPAGGSDDGDKITWTNTFNDGDTWAKTIRLDAPTDTCAAGHVYTNTLSISPTVINDCNGCPIPGTDPTSFGIYVNNNEEQAIVDQSKSVDYLNVNSNGLYTDAQAAEDCTQIQYMRSVTFNTGPSAPQTWSGILFRDDMNEGQIYVSLDAVNVDGTDYKSAVSVTNTSGYLEIDLSGLDGAGAPVPNSGALLEFVYTLSAADGAEGSFIDWSHLYLPGYGPGECDGEDEYNQGVQVTISETSVGVSLSVPAILDKCETDTYTLNVSKTDFQAYDVVITFDTNGNYNYIPGSTQFEGFTDESATPINAFEPTLNEDQLSWNLGDLSSAGTISINLIKCCETTDTSYSATADYNDNCDNQPDGSVTSRDHQSSASAQAGYLAQADLHIVVEPSSYFTVSGYPRFKVYLLNTGDGTAYNASLMLDFNGPFSYKSYSASEVPPTGFTGSPGDTSVTWQYDTIPPGEKSVLIVTGELTGCGASPSVDGSASWGCCSQTIQCQTNLPVTDSMVLEQPGANVVIIDHTMSPDLVDYCGDHVTFTITAKNYGPAVAYHPWLQETVAGGLSYVSQTAQYSLDRGTTWSDFPGEYTHNTGQEFKWSFVDPNDDGDDSDHLLTTTDNYGNYVLESGKTMSIRFQAKIVDCDDASVFYFGNRYNEAQSNYDMPCNHTNTGDPTETSRTSILGIEAAEPHVSVDLQAKNNTQGTTFTNTEVYGTMGDALVFRVTLESDGDYTAKQVYLENILPTNVTYTGWAHISGQLVSKDGNTWHVDRDGDDNWNEDDSFLNPSEGAVFEIYGDLADCGNTSDTATVHWGCCSTDQGSQSDSVDLVIPKEPIVQIDATGFSTCGGDITVTIENPDQYNKADQLNLVVTVPTSGDTDYAWEYDPSAGGAQIISNQAHSFSEAEEEPVLSENNTVLTFARASDGGNITNGNAYIDPQETLTITFHVKASGNFCDTAFSNDSTDPDVGTIPTDDATADLAYRAPCDQVFSLPEVSDTVDSVQPDVDIISVTATPELATSGDQIHWAIVLQNNGDGKAENVALESVFGSGYDDTSVTNITNSGSWSSGSNTVTWSSITLDPQETETYEYDVVIAGTGSLTNTVTSTGQCLDAAGDPVCNHSYDQLIGQAAGVVFDKEITNINAPGSIDPDGKSGQATIGNLVTYQIFADYLGDGDYQDVTITDVIPSGMEFVSQSSTSNPQLDVSFNQSGNDLTWTLDTGSPPAFSGSTSITITVKTRVRDDPSNKWTPETILTNQAHTDLTLNGVFYTHTNSEYGSAITDDNEVTVIEPWIADDESHAKTSSPACDSADHTGTPVEATNTIDYTFTAKNTGTSPAYDLVFVDTIPVGMREAQPSVTSVTVDTRTLTSGTDYTTSWNSGAGILTITLQDSTDAAIQANELMTIVYQAKVDPGVGAGAYLDNSGRVESYTSLPADGSVPEEEGNEREYGNAVGSGNYGYLPEKVCQHHTQTLPENTKTVEADLSSPTGLQTVNNAQIGETLTYTVTITVPTGTTAYDMEFSDTIPDGLTVESASYKVGAGAETDIPFAEDSDGTTAVSQIIGDTVGNETVTVTIVVTVDQQYDGGVAVSRGNSFDNTAAYSWNRVDNDPNTQLSVDSNTVSTTIQEPNMVISKETDDSDGVVEQGQTINYTITVQNIDSTGLGYDPTITDIVPPDLRDPTVVSVTLNGGSLSGSDYDYSYTPSTGEMVFDLNHSGANAIDPGSELVIVYEVSVPADIGSGRVGARALVNETDATSYSLPIGINDAGRRQYSTGPVRAPLTTLLGAITKTQSPGDGETVQSGDSISYTLTFPDPSIQATLYDVSVVDTVPDGLSITNLTATGGTNPAASHTGREVTATFDKIGPAEQGTVTITCTVNATFDSASAISPGQAFPNRATLDWYDASSSAVDRRNHVALSNTITAYFQGAAIVLDPDHTRHTFPGAIITYHHTLENLGSESDTVSLNYGPSTQGWDWILYRADANGNITGTPIASGDTIDIAAGDTQGLIMRAFVPADTPPGTTDIIELVAQGANNSDSVTNITLVSQGKMRLEKRESADGGTTWNTSIAAGSGDTVRFRLEFTNTGTVELSNVRVIDAVPDYTTYMAGTAAVNNDGSYQIYYSQDGGVSWGASEPSPELVTHIKWEYLSNVSPGESHYVTYEVELK